MIPFLKSRGPNAVLGLGFDHGRIGGVILRRAGEALQIQSSFRAALSLDPLTNDPELVGREIQNHLRDAGVREKRCVVSVPLNWVLTVQIKLPELPEPDLTAFINVQAERGFPYAPEDLLVAASRYRTANGEQYATLVAIPKNHVVLLEKALKAAKLKPRSYTLGSVALGEGSSDPATGVAVLALGEDSVDLQFFCGGGVTALRALEGTFEMEAGQKRVYADLVAREIKITLGQLPGELRETVRKINVVGRGDTTERLVREITPRADGMGLAVETTTEYRPGEFGLELPPNTPVSPPLSIAARYLSGSPLPFEFVLPKVSSWPQFSGRFSSRRVLLAGSAAAAVVLLLGGLFSAQQMKLSRLDTQWRTMDPKVRELDAMQQQIKKYRPWYDSSVRSLTIVRKLTEAFPQDGAVSAKTLQIRDLTVICSGVAKDNQSLDKVLEQLRAAREIDNLHLASSLGSSPVQFTFNFQWKERAGEP